MLDRVHIWTLRQAGHTLEEIAASVGVGRRSMQRILREPQIISPEDGRVTQRLSLGEIEGGATWSGRLLGLVTAV